MLDVTLQHVTAAVLQAHRVSCLCCWLVDHLMCGIIYTENVQTPAQWSRVAVVSWLCCKHSYVSTF